MKRLVILPLLRNPERWLQKNKYIDPSSCSESFYNRSVFSNDPYVGMLCNGYGRDMRSRSVFPRSQMVRLSVDENLAKDVTIRQTVTTDDSVARKMFNGYVLNNYWYLLYSIFTGQWKRFTPPLYRTKASKTALKNVEIDDKLYDTISTEYVDAIREDFLGSDHQNREINLKKSEFTQSDIDNGSFLTIKREGKSEDPLVLQLDTLPPTPREALKETFKEDISIQINSKNKRILRYISMLFNYYTR